MFKSILIIASLCIAGISAKAQYIRYDPLPPLPPLPAVGAPAYNTPPSYQQQQPALRASEAQRVQGYIFNSSTRTIRKVNLQIVVEGRSIAVTAVKELQDEYWTNFSVNKPVAEKLMYNEAYSENFEYKVYVPVLGQVVYF